MRAEELFDQLNSLDESSRLEAKRGEQAGRSILETICAFSNEPGLGGGTILVGVARAENALWPSYEVTGVADPDRFQADLATQCASEFNTRIRPRFQTDSLDGKTV